MFGSIEVRFSSSEAYDIEAFGFHALCASINGESGGRGEELGAFGGIEGHGLDSFSMGCRWFGTKTITKWGMKSNLLSKRCAGGVSGGGLAEAAKGFAD